MSGCSGVPLHDHEGAGGAVIALGGATAVSASGGSAGGAGTTGGGVSTGGIDTGTLGGTSGTGADSCSQYASLRKSLNEAYHWGAAVPYRSAASMVVKVRRRDSNSFCYLQKAGPLECLDSVAQSSWRYQPDGGAVVDFEFSPEGGLVVAERIPSPIEGKGFLSLSRLDANGNRTASKILIDSPTAADLVTYDILPSGQITTYELAVSEASHEGRPFLTESLGWRKGTLVQLKWIAGHLYLLASNHTGLRLYQLSEDLDVNWKAPVMPTILMSVAQGRNAALVQGPGSSILVVFDMAEIEDQVFERHLSRRSDQTITGQDIVVEAFSNQGAFESLTPIGKQEYREYFADAVRVGESVWVAANTRHRKTDNPNDPTELDMVLVEFDATARQMKNHSILDYKNEDFALTIDALPSGNLVMGGRTDYLLAQTNSQVSFGSGLLLEVAPNGKALRSATFATPRDVGVMSVLPLDADCQLFAGWNDAPITHTCEADTSESCSHVNGMVALGSLSPD